MGLPEIVTLLVSLSSYVPSAAFVPSAVKVLSPPDVFETLDQRPNIIHATLPVNELSLNVAVVEAVMVWVSCI